MTLRRLRGDAGQVSGIEAVPFGLLVLTVGILLVAHTWAVVDARFVTATAAREATRAFVESPAPELADTRARSAARAVVVRAGRDPGSLRLDRVGTGFARCARTRFQAVFDVPAVLVPWRGPRPATSVRSTHTEVVDPYRDGLPGVAACGGAP